jgi:hypothetical protein
LRATGSRECAPDDRLREAIHKLDPAKKLDCFVAMTVSQAVGWVERSDTHQLHFVEMMLAMRVCA